MDLTWMFPVPEPVRVGARDLVASPLSLGDLARLQGFAKSRSPCPIDEASAAIDAMVPGTEAARRLLRDTYNACQKWPPRLGTEAGQALLNTPVGLMFWLNVVLSRDNPDLSGGDIRELAESITFPQYRVLQRIAYGIAPLDELSRLITPDSFPDKPDELTNWAEAIVELVGKTGWTFAQCAEVRVTQYAALQTDGKVGKGKADPPPGMGRWEFSKRQRRFFGPDREEEGVPGGN